MIYDSSPAKTQPNATGHRQPWKGDSDQAHNTLHGFRSSHFSLPMQRIYNELRRIKAEAYRDLDTRDKLIQELEADIDRIEARMLDIESHRAKLERDGKYGERAQAAYERVYTSNERLLNKAKAVLASLAPAPQEQDDPTIEASISMPGSQVLVVGPGGSIFGHTADPVERSIREWMARTGESRMKQISAQQEQKQGPEQEE